MIKKFAAEAVATMILVLLGCGTAIVTDNIVAIAAAFGMSIIILAYTVGPISGGHANPAVSFAKALNKELTWKEFGVYVAGQIVGAFVGSLLLAMVMWAWKSGVQGQNHLYQMPYFVEEFGATGFMTVMLTTMCEMGLTFLFVFAVLGVTSKKEWAGIAGIVIGLALFGVHLVGIPLTGTSVNPARALSALVFSMFNGVDVGVKALTLIPMIVGPFMGAFAAFSAFKGFFGKKQPKAEEKPAEEAAE